MSTSVDIISAGSHNFVYDNRQSETNMLFFICDDISCFIGLDNLGGCYYGKLLSAL